MCAPRRRGWRSKTVYLSRNEKQQAIDNNSARVFVSSSSTLKLPRSFYEQSTVDVAKRLLGKFLVRRHPEGNTAGRIVETEAYIGPQDLACHASKGRTARTEVMFGPPGHAYVYFIYGFYNMLNLVTEAKDYPSAVLIRAVEPTGGVEVMKSRRKLDTLR